MSYKDYINELDALSAVMEKTPQTVGFVHRFYVPGWIGFIQVCIVEHKMDKAAKRLIYKNLDYLDCADRIIELTQKACEARKQSEDFQEKENGNLDNLAIANSCFRAIDAWVNIYPEIASWMNRQIDDNHVTCVLGIVQKNVVDSLSEIMEVPTEKSNYKPNSSFMREMKAMGNQIAAMFCNVIIFAAVASLISAIF